MASSNTPSLYEILGIDKSASSDEIRKAYKQKALRNHPDKLDPRASEEEKQAAESQFHKVYEAFEILTDPQKRRAYDVRINARGDYQATTQASETLARRMREREEWARKQQEQRKLRLDEIYGRQRLEKEKKLAEDGAAPAQGKNALVQELLQAMWAVTPELKERHQAALKRKMARMANASVRS